MDRLRKHYSHFLGVWFLARKAVWALSRCMTTDRADYYCMLVNEWACMVKVMSLLMICRFAK